ncbi:hypothetical protein [Cyanobium sp. Morenito 9A2]|uniref:hypothetical protein n=1 Tax=Cyanobium sp. Morenito 9A2 TaxID=2823718 RepID=UPI0020CE5B96|nr:hypothetical protein [Cyanobium sp. Morenito 9A2]MCP9848380.1 hypothetical protein [Cyanobium sp. Morenito 9A2]
MSNLQRSKGVILLAGGLAGAALLVPAAALAQSRPVIVERTTTTVQYREDGFGGYRQPTYLPAPVRQVYAAPLGARTYGEVYRPTYQASYQPVYGQPVYGQPRYLPQGYVQPGYRQVYSQPTYGQSSYGPQGYGGPAVANGPLTVADAQQLQQSCQIGRLVGGLVGGGLGYAASRQDGRAWAVPLGALLGTQVGCNTAVGKGPTLW